MEEKKPEMSSKNYGTLTLEEWRDPDRFERALDRDGEAELQEELRRHYPEGSVTYSGPPGHSAEMLVNGEPTGIRAWRIPPET